MPWPKGKPRSPETRAKLSEAGKRRYEKPEERRRSSLAAELAGCGYYERTPEHRQRQSEKFREREREGRAS
jgi:hypothetical protein